MIIEKNDFEKLSKSMHIVLIESSNRQKLIKNFSQTSDFIFLDNWKKIELEMGFAMKRSESLDWEVRWNLSIF